MKRAMLVLAIITCVGTACSPARANPMGAAGGGAMQPMTELVVGTLQLDGTADAVTAEQASELLPMWEVYQEISSSDTAAQPEIDGLMEQLQAAMTDAQRKSIDAMDLTQEDVMAVMQQQGPAMASEPRPASGGSNGGFPGGGFPGGGGMPPGGMPDGGMEPGGGFSGGAQAVGTPRAVEAQARARATGVPAPLLNALIEYLRERAAS